MLNFIIRTSLRHRLFVLAIAAGLMAFGMFQAGQLPIDVLPDLACYFNYQLIQRLFYWIIMGLLFLIFWTLGIWH